MHRRRQGFTLIEMLVVIAVIAVLAGIIFPVFAKARERAYTADCTNNVKQLGMAFKMYLSDWGGRFPSGGNGWATFNMGSDWVHINAQNQAGNMSVERGSLFPYVKEAGSYVCKNAIIAAEPAQSGGTRTSYTMNSNLVGAGTGVGATGAGIRLQHVRFPSRTFLLVEENDESLGFGTGQYNDGVFYAPANGSGWDEPPGKSTDSERHGGFALAAFVDGSAKAFPFIELTPYTGSAPGTASKLNPWYYPKRKNIDSR